jgi:hypothetical protein
MDRIILMPEESPQPVDMTMCVKLTSALIPVLAEAVGFNNPPLKNLAILNRREQTKPSQRQELLLDAGVLFMADEQFVLVLSPRGFKC